MRPIPFESTTARAFLWCAAVALSCGCGPRDEIKTYVIATPEDAAKPAAAQPVAPAEAVIPAADRGEPTDRMIAAIIDGRQRAWFFKAVGKTDAIAGAADSIDAFYKSLRMEGQRPVWDLPVGWNEKQGGSMRLATLVVPAEGAAEGAENAAGEIELSVIGLPKVGEWPAQVLDNVNRWRKQLGQPPYDSASIGDATQPLDSVAPGSVMVDLIGWFDGGSMPPFAAGRGRAGGVANPPAAKPPAAKPPAAKPPAARPPASTSQSNELQDERPEGWVAEPGSAMRKASYKTALGSIVTAFAFPATAPAMADPLANVNRWRGEIGLAPTTPDDLLKQTETIGLMGDQATYVELVGEEETTLAAMTKRGQRVWFFKLRGPTAAAEADRSAFREWLGSLRVAE